MPRFFVPREGIDEAAGVITIVGRDARHIALSLRMAEGDELVVSDGLGREYHSRLTRIREDECRLEILRAENGRGESPVPITLYMAYPKGDKLEVVVQKAVELGASAIVPFVSERCIKRPVAGREEKQTERLRAIAHEAAGQCGRSVLPRVSSSVSFDEMLRQASENELTLFCYEGEKCRSLRSVLKGRRGASSIGVIVGSEGGFSPREAEAAEAHGAISVSLGERILRCETAPDFCLSAISYELELGE